MVQEAAVPVNLRLVMEASGRRRGVDGVELEVELQRVLVGHPLLRHLGRERLVGEDVQLELAAKGGKSTRTRRPPPS